MQEQGCSGVMGSSLENMAWLGWPPPASYISSAREPLEGKRSSILAQHPAGMSFLLGGNTASLDRKIGLFALSQAV